jgi:hypothetical protein
MTWDCQRGLDKLRGEEDVLAGLVGNQIILDNGHAVEIGDKR